MVVAADHIPGAACVGRADGFKVLWLCRVVRDAINLEITFYHQPARTEAARRAGDDCVERR
jgi:hypothetical protein